MSKYKEPTVIIRGEWMDVYTPYSQRFVADLKVLVPYQNKKPVYEDKKFDCWRVRRSHEADILSLIDRCYGKDAVIEYGEKLNGDGLDKQATSNLKTDPHVRRFEVWYVGRCKERDQTDKPSAFFMNQDQDWVGLIPEDVLKAWFAEDVETADYFTILGIRATSTDIEVKKAYRAMMRQYHPDVYDGDDATERSMVINEAYEHLKTAQGRKRYKACLYLEGMASGMDAGITGVRAANKETDSKYGYRCPKPNGMIKMTGVEIPGVRSPLFLATQILQWDPVIRDGKRLISAYKLRDKLAGGMTYGLRFRRRYGNKPSANDYVFAYEWV